MKRSTTIIIITIYYISKNENKNEGKEKEVLEIEKHSNNKYND